MGYGREMSVATFCFLDCIPLPPFLFARAHRPLFRALTRSHSASRGSRLALRADAAQGGNWWRTSHNPYRPAMYDILDKVGVLVWDENRDFNQARGFSRPRLQNRLLADPGILRVSSGYVSGYVSGYP